jgi:membrane dipeptidase
LITRSGPGAATTPRETGRLYRQAIVIDALGGLPDDPGLAAEAPLSARALQDIRRSGVTAISLTLSVGTSGDRLGKAIRRIATYDEKVAAAPDALVRIRGTADLQMAKRTGRLGLIYNVQDTSLLETDLSRVELLGNLGLRVMQMTYNQRNTVGDGCLEPGDAGLSIFGVELVAELARQRIVMDLSHGGRRTIAEAIANAKLPPIISHTGCRDLVDLPRNVHDRELRALAEKGGVVGIYFMPFLTAAGPAQPSDLIRHLEHALNACGEDHVGLGTDGPISGIVVDDTSRRALQSDYEERVRKGLAAPGEGPDRWPFVEGYNDPRRFLTLAESLAQRGWPSRRIEKLLGGNFQRVYSEVWRT